MAKKKAATPESITPHSGDCIGKTWQEYSLRELGCWVHLLAKRAEHRVGESLREKDLYDAQNYLNMMQAKLDNQKEA